MTTWKKLSTRVVLVMGLNPGAYTLGGTNTYLVGTGASRLLIDTGAGADGYVDNLRSAMAATGTQSIAKIICTHWHHDHTGGIASVLERWPGVPLLKLLPSPAGAEAIDEESGNVPDFVPFDHKYENVNDGDRLTTEGATLRVMRTPGHTFDHISLVCEEDGSVFGGDNILGGTEGTVFSDLAQYMASLHALLALAPATIYPGHGPHIGDGVGAIEAYIRHRESRVAQVIDALRAAAGVGTDAGTDAGAEAPGAALTVQRIVARLYPGLAELLLPAAENNTRLVLVAIGGGACGDVDDARLAEACLAATRAASASAL